MKTCEFCLTPFNHGRINQRYCSINCIKRAYVARHPDKRKESANAWARKFRDTADPALLRTRHSWSHALSRCLDPNNNEFHRYGAKGIMVCKRWRAFKNFLSDMGLRPDNKSLDRIDGSGNYEPGNCRWATSAEQSRNKKNNHLIAYDGRTQVLTDWAKEFGLKTATLADRVRKGWPIEVALTKPVLLGNNQYSQSSGNFVSNDLGDDLINRLGCS